PPRRPAPPGRPSSDEGPGSAPRARPGAAAGPRRPAPPDRCPRPGGRRATRGRPRRWGGPGRSPGRLGGPLFARVGVRVLRRGRLALLAAAADVRAVGGQGVL